jgi:hypothetical protein
MEGVMLQSLAVLTRFAATCLFALLVLGGGALAQQGGGGRGGGGGGGGGGSDGADINTFFPSRQPDANVPRDRTRRAARPVIRTTTVCVGGSGTRCNLTSPKPRKPKVVIRTVKVDRAVKVAKLRAKRPPLPKTTTLAGFAAPPGKQQPPGAGGGQANGPLRLPPASLDSPFVPDEVLVTMAPATPPAVDDQVAAAYGLQLLSRDTLDLIGQRLVRYRIPDGRPVATLLALLATEPRVAAPQPNFIYRQQSDPSRPWLKSAQYGLEKIAAPAAHALAHGRGVLVGVIDSAVDGNHVDLAGALAGTFDAIGEPLAADLHGTGIAGIIAGRGTIEGIAPEARLLAARAFVPGSGRRQGRTTTQVLLKSFDWCAREGARVLNLSFAGPQDPLARQSVQAAAARGIVMVAAAGNGGPSAPPAYPGAYDEVIAVTAIDTQDRLYPAANRGTYVAIAAPGVDVLVAAPGNGHDMQSGTSFAAAFVSGVAALMIERNPDLKPDALKALVMRTATELGGPGRDAEFGAGRVNALASVEGSKK